MSFHRPTRLQLAIHEAGHAYVFAALTYNSPPHELGLAYDGRNHRGWSLRRTILNPKGRPRCTSQADRTALRSKAAAEIVIAMAGPIAEFRHRHRSRDGGALVFYLNLERFLQPGAFDVDGDFQKIRDCLEHVRSADRVTSLRALFDVAESAVSTNWPAIRRLARLLMDRGRLDEDQLSDWFETMPATLCGVMPEIR